MVYDRSVLTLYCGALIAASWAYIVLALLFGAGLGFGIGLLIDHLRPHSHVGVLPGTFAGFGALVFAGLGWLLSYTVRVKAHEILCQVEIEKHLSVLAGSTPQEQRADSRHSGATADPQPRIA